jgi:hypothetical protein
MSRANHFKEPFLQLPVRVSRARMKSRKKLIDYDCFRFAGWSIGVHLARANETIIAGKKIDTRYPMPPPL